MTLTLDSRSHDGRDGDRSPALVATDGGPATPAGRRRARLREWVLDHPWPATLVVGVSTLTAALWLAVIPFAASPARATAPAVLHTCTELCRCSRAGASVRLAPTPTQASPVR